VGSHPSQKHVEAYVPTMTQREFVEHLNVLQAAIAEARRHESHGPGAGHVSRDFFCRMWHRRRLSRETKYNFAKACYDAGKFLPGDPVEPTPEPQQTSSLPPTRVVKDGKLLPE